MVLTLRFTTLLIVSLSLLGCNKERVIAEVNGKPVTQKAFDAYLTIKNIPASDEKRREATLDEYLARAALAEQIELEGKVDPAIVEAELAEFKKEMLISRYFEQLMDEKVTDEAVQAAYNAEAAKFEQKKVHAAHILIRTDKRMSEEQRKAKLTTAQEVYSKLQAGEDFAELANKFSEDKISGSRGGDLGWLKEGSIDERFSKRAFEMKTGAVTEPFETPFGFHILKVLEEPKTIRRPFGAVAGEIRYRLRGETKDKETARLKAAAAIEKKEPYDPKATPVSSAAPSSKRPPGLPASTPEANDAPFPGSPGAGTSPAAPAGVSPPGTLPPGALPPGAAPMTPPPGGVLKPSVQGAGAPKAPSTVAPKVPAAAPQAPRAPTPAPVVPAAPPASPSPAN